MARILVADDDSDIRDLLVLMLRSAGHEVDAIADGAAAIEAWEAADFDLVLLDWQMPRVDGLGVLRHIRADRARGWVPVMMVSANADSLPAPDHRGAADAVLAKPFSFAGLTGRVDRLLRERVTVSSR